MSVELTDNNLVGFCKNQNTFSNLTTFIKIYTKHCVRARTQRRRQIPEIDASLGNTASIKATIQGRLVCHNTQ